LKLLRGQDSIPDVLFLEKLHSVGRVFTGKTTRKREKTFFGNVKHVFQAGEFTVYSGRFWVTLMAADTSKTEGFVMFNRCRRDFRKLLS
jgi:hypothetical protein